MSQQTLAQFGFRRSSNKSNDKDPTQNTSTNLSVESAEPDCEVQNPQSKEGSTEKRDLPSTSSSAKNSKSTDAKPSSRKKYPKRFQTKWTSEFAWLYVDAGKMLCKTCVKSDLKQNTVFITGCKNFQRSALVRHQNSDEHRTSALACKQKVYMETAVKVVAEGLKPVLESQLRTALYMASENIANRKFLSMIDLQIANTHLYANSAGCSMGPIDRNSVKGIHTNHQTPARLQGYLADVLREMAIVRIQNSPFIGIMVDESLDIATNKKLVMFCKIVNEGEVKIEFCSNIDIVNGKADTVYNAIVGWLQSVGVPIDRVSGFGSDGAAVMTGKRSGVGVRLKSDNPRIIHIWCAAHRVALVSYWAAKKVQYLQNVQTTLVNIYTLFEFSAPRYNKLRELKTLMGGKVKKFKKPTQVRWLSLQDAIEAVYDSWSSLVLALEHEVAEAPHSEGGNKAKGILKQVNTFKFISTLCLLKDILSSLCKLSRFFQKDIIDIQHVVSMITATKDTLTVYQQPDIETPTVEYLIESIDDAGMFQGIELECSLRDRAVLLKIRRDLLGNILREFDERFPPEDMGILKDLNSVLNPALLPQGQQSIIEHGLDCLERVLVFFGDLINAQEVKGNFLQFKFFLNVNRHFTLQDMCMQLISVHSDTYPNMAKLATVLMTVPLTSVPCERGFSSQNRQLGKFTNRRNVANVENRMVIEYYTRQLSAADQDEVIRKAAFKCNL